MLFYMFFAVCSGGWGSILRNRTSGNFHAEKTSNFDHLFGGTVPSIRYVPSHKLILELSCLLGLRICWRDAAIATARDPARLCGLAVAVSSVLAIGYLSAAMMGYMGNEDASDDDEQHPPIPSPVFNLFKNRSPTTETTPAAPVKGTKPLGAAPPASAGGKVDGQPDAFADAATDNADADPNKPDATASEKLTAKPTNPTITAPEKPSSRFANADADMLKPHRPPNSVRQANSGHRTFQAWVNEKNKTGADGELLELTKMSHEDLTQHLKVFFVEVRQEDGSYYTPGSLDALKNNIQRYLNYHNEDCKLDGRESVAGHVVFMSQAWAKPIKVAFDNARIK